MINLKKISVLGATGSVGINILKLILKDNKKYKVLALTAHRNYKLLSKYSKLLNVEFAAIADDHFLNKLKSELKYTNIKCISGKEAICKAAKIKTDITFSSIIGVAGLKPTYEAISATKVLAIANKESLVSAGNLLIKKAKLHKTKILPLDSEHNAIFQVIEKENKKKIKNITLTASGGPFWKKNNEYFKKITVSQALKHPNWKMGKKITIDSATMVNKLLEVVEASILFNIDLKKIKILIHPDSIAHGIVDFIDGSSYLVMSKPHMQIPINYALNWPDRTHSTFKNIDLSKIRNLNFYKIDTKKFPSLGLINLLNKGKFYNCKLIVLNAANEIAVENFLKNKIKFLDIVKIIKEAITTFEHSKILNINDVLDVNKRAKDLTKNILIKKGYNND